VGEDQIEYVIAAIPLGGYVKMLGEGDPNAEIKPEEMHRAFDHQPIWKRTLIVAAGPGINFLFAVILFLLLGLMSKDALVPILGDVPESSLVAQSGILPGDKLKAVDGREVQFFGEQDLHIFRQVLKGKDITITVERDTQDKTVSLSTSTLPIYNISPSFLANSIGLIPISPEITTTIDRVIDDSPAQHAGIKQGDTILSIDGQSMDSWKQLVSVVSKAPEQQLRITIQRGKVVQDIFATPALHVLDDQQEVGRLGIGPVFLPFAQKDQVQVSRTLWQSFNYGVEQTWLMTSVTVRMLWKMLTLQVSHQNISGPITIAEVSGKAIQLGLDYYLHILAVISISLGVMNLLPIPMLDGGHLLMYAVETVAGAKWSERVFMVGQRIGVILLICLMSLAFYNDIFRLLN